MVGKRWSAFIGETAIGDLIGWSHAVRAEGLAGVRPPGPHAGGPGTRTERYGWRILALLNLTPADLPECGRIPHVGPIADDRCLARRTGMRNSSALRQSCEHEVHSIRQPYRPVRTSASPSPLLQ